MLTNVLMILMLKYSFLPTTIMVHRLNKEEFDRIKKATDVAISRILTKGADDVFRPPTFAHSIETEILSKVPEEFRKEASRRTIDFLKAADLKRESIGPTRRGLVSKDQNSFRQCAWLDPFDAVKYLAAAYLVFETIESARIPKDKCIVHSHRFSTVDGELFDPDFGYDSFRARSAEISKKRIGQWKVVTDISNFFDRIGNHSLENHLLDIKCDEKYVTLIREMLFFWAGDRRSFGVPVGSDASRILSEAVLLNVDQSLLAQGVDFVRYVDDFRIFAKDRAEATKNLEILTTLLADEGLSLNSKKTEIHEITESEDLVFFTNRFAEGEHEKIDIEQRVEIIRDVRVSGRSSISRFYKEPGKEALRNIQKLQKEDVIKSVMDAPEHLVEQQVKLLVKFFVYADQDTSLLKILLDKRITSIYYLADALIREAEKFDEPKRREIKSVVFGALDWNRCAHPLQIPILRISGHPAYLEPLFVRTIVDGHMQSDSMIFYREAISLGARCLDRPRLRKLAIDIYPNVPDFVRRAIYCAIMRHENLPNDEKRPLLKNMEQHSKDWFIANI